VSRPLVSVVLPVFDGERFLAEAIESALAQTWPAVEVVVVDDGSADRSAEIAASYPVRLLRQDNSGVAAARNRGVEAAAGGLLAFLDQDDLWLPEKLERQAERLLEAEADLCVCEMEVFAEPGFDPERMNEAWAGGSHLATQLGTVLVRRGAFERIGPFDTSYRTISDTDWFLRARDLGVEIVHVRECLQRYRLHGGNDSASAGGMRRETARALAASIARKREAPDA